MKLILIAKCEYCDAARLIECGSSPAHSFEFLLKERGRFAVKNQKWACPLCAAKYDALIEKQKNERQEFTP